MRKVQKKWAEDFVKLLSQAHDEIRKALEIKKIDVALDLLEQCQNGAIRLGELIEEAEGEQFTTIPLLEDYCELTYQIHEEIGSEESISSSNTHKKLQKSLIRIQNSIRNDIKIKLEIAFLPYKASMWDSLESVWMAADTDPDCDAYVVPIPYYERNSDGSLGTYHYEGSDIPDYVPVTHYDCYHLEERQPDVIYIHNPYDQGNYVTSIDPRYYSVELKKYTELLIYIPYYSTSGGMSEAQSKCIAYYNADYIVIQAEKYRKFFDASIPQEKLVPLGSPKFDRAIRMSNNPPEPPIEWKSKMEGKKVYFYNTSIDGMLSNTKKFLYKMEYVFKCFKGRADACMVWRPHPLLESTFDSMRKNFRPFYDELKRYFIENNLGIYDDTPDIEKTIALCDAYIGDAGTSVTSLFGIIGKPLFILNNNINTLPEENDWRGEIITGFNELNEDDRWMVTQGNKLYYSDPGKYDYHYLCDLCEYSAPYYSIVRSFENRDYVCPINAQDILMIADKKVTKRIKLERRTEKGWVFAGSLKYENNIILIPAHYGAVVKYDIESEEIKYITENINIFVRETTKGLKVGGYCIYKNYLIIASPVDDYVYTMNIDTEEVVILKCGGSNEGGCSKLVVDNEDIWMIPRNGSIVKKWNPITGGLQEYDVFSDELKCIHPVGEYECTEFPFGNPAVTEDFVYLPQYWGNIHARIDKKSGIIEKWEPHFVKKSVSGYYTQACGCNYIRLCDNSNNQIYRMYSVTDRSLYDVDLKTGKCNEIKIAFDKEELINHEPGFSKCDEWLQYCGRENAFNTLEQFLMDTCVGGTFSRKEQMLAYETVSANFDGSCGEKVHEFILKHLQKETL